MYRIMAVIKGINEYKTVETGYEASDLEEADRIRNQLLDLNPEMNFVVFGLERKERKHGKS